VLAVHGQYRLAPTLLVLAALLAWPMGAAHAKALRPVTLQLKWTHQFQFAGYYAAQEQGFYRDAGLNVIFKEHRPGMTPEAEVLQGRAEFGISGTNALLAYLNGQPVVALASIFQHSAECLLVLADSGIRNPADLKGKRIMLDANPTPPIRALLALHGIGNADIKIQQLSGNIADLIQGETDAMTAYLTAEPYAFERTGIPVRTLKPSSYGVDFYGDCLITSKRLTEDDPELVDRFVRASLKGWRYALANPGEVVELIRARYNSDASRDALEHEASAMRPLILPELVDVGTMSRDRWRRIMLTCQAAGLIDHIHPLDDFFLVPPEGRSRGWVREGLPYLLLAGGIIAAVMALLLFRSRRLRAEVQAGIRELRLNRESLRQLIDLVPNMIYAKDREGRFLLANRAMADSMGCTVETLKGALESDVHPDMEQARRRLAEDRMVFDTGHPKVSLEEPFRYPDGSMHWLQTTRLPYISADTGQPAVLGLSVDITERRQADKALKDSEERFRAIFNQTYQFTGILARDGTVIQANDSSLTQLGIRQEDILGKPFWEANWFERSVENRTWISESVRRAARGEIVRREFSAVSGNGTPMTVDFSLKPARDDEGNIIFLIIEGRDITALKQTEDKLRKLNEELERRVADRTDNLEKANAKLEHSLAELSRTQEELLLSEKLAALGSLVAGVAHEINTPLGIGVTASSFLSDRIAELDRLLSKGELKKSDLERFLADGKESSASTLTNLNRAAGLISSFKQVAADQSSEMPRQFNLHDYVDEVLLSLRPKFKNTGHIVENTCPDLEIYSYPGAFVQIITNLLTNALTYAFDPRETGHIEIGATVNGPNLEFTFSDDGAGIPESIADRIFEPFVTTRRGSGGTGLGLHIVFNIVNKVLGGAIRFTTGPRQGTSYTITIPLQHAGKSAIPEDMHDRQT
jgi:PAS domain S-box-containing protein